MRKSVAVAMFLAAGIVFCLAVLVLAWFVNEKLIWLMAPGIPIVNAWGRNPRLHNQEVEQLIFVISNGLVWALIFWAAALGWRKWRGSGR